LGGPLIGHHRLWDAPALYLERSPISAAKEIVTPLLLLHGENDRLVPASASEELFQAVSSAGGRCRYVCIPGEDHIFRSIEGTAAFVNEIVSWIGRHVGRQDARAETVSLASQVG
jgi:dipeptidyl aminopeptidase/acylaminoacyl peptidase